MHDVNIKHIKYEYLIRVLVLENELFSMSVYLIFSLVFLRNCFI